jgi:CBS domain containing-hemolysin-like protein
VIFSMPESATVESYLREHGERRFSRVPIYRAEGDDITGFVLRGDLLQATAEGRQDAPLADFRRHLPVIPPGLPLARAFQLLQDEQVHIALVVDEYGSVRGLLTLEDILETLLGTEIVDESDTDIDMQEVARRRWRRRAQRMGLDIESADREESSQ